METNETRNCPECGQFGAHTVSCSKRPPEPPPLLMAQAGKDTKIRSHTPWWIILTIAGVIVSAFFILRQVELNGPERAFGPDILRSVITDKVVEKLRAKDTRHKSVSVQNIAYTRKASFDSKTDETFEDKNLITGEQYWGHTFNLSSDGIIYYYKAEVAFDDGETTNFTGALAFRRILGKPSFANKEGWAGCRVPDTLK